MNRYSKYFKGCRNCVDIVDNALAKGVVLSPEETLDYYFKSLCNYRSNAKSVITNFMYRLANFYSKVVRSLWKMSKEGYCNETAFKLFNKVNNSALFSRGYCADSIAWFDKNGKLYIEVNYDSSEDYYEYRIGCFMDLNEALADFTSMLVENCGKYSDFCADYIVNVIHDVVDMVEPVPFMNMSEDKILSNVIGRYSNIISLANYNKIGGTVNGRNERDIEKRRAVAGV